MRKRTWTTNDEKNTDERFRHLVSSSGKRRKTDYNKKEKEAEKRTDEEATKLDSLNSYDPVWLPPSRQSSFIRNYSSFEAPSVLVHETVRFLCASTAVFVGRTFVFNMMVQPY